MSAYTKGIQGRSGWGVLVGGALSLKHNSLDAEDELSTAGGLRTCPSKTI